MGRLRNLPAEAAERAALAAASSAAAVPAERRGRHQISPELEALLTESVPANTRKAWVSRFDRGFRPWAEARYGSGQVMPPTDEMLSEYIRHLGFEKGLRLATLEAHLGTVLGVTRAWVDQQCALRATYRATRAADRDAQHARLDAEERSDAAQPPAPAEAERRRADRAARRFALDTEELADERHRRADPQVPTTRLATRAIKACAAERVRKGQSTAPRKATVLTPDQIKAIVAAIDTSTAIGKRDKALLLVWFAGGRRGDETSSQYISDLRFARPHGVRIEIRRSKTNPHGRDQDSLKIPYNQNAADYPFCPVRALEAWLTYLAAPIDPRHPERGPRYAGPGAQVPLWPRIGKGERFGTEAGGRARDNPDDDGSLSTQGMREILQRRALAVGIEVSGDVVDEHGEVHRVQVSPHTMRRSLITAAAEAGKDILDVAVHVGMKPGSDTLYEYWELSARGWDHTAAGGLLEPPKP